ncbi:hypothetical protein PTKIN_Ptkin14bG0223400 [Pterospermum kingtungense]
MKRIESHIKRPHSHRGTQKGSLVPRTRRDTHQAQERSPSATAQRVPLQVDNPGDSPNEVSDKSLSEIDVFGTGLQNEIGTNNCFLNVIIESLWHMRRFRDEFFGRWRSCHAHVGEPCVVCALYQIFTSLRTAYIFQKGEKKIASTNAQRKPVSPTRLRKALLSYGEQSNNFQMGQMNDASEVLTAIFDCFHKSFISGSNVSGAGSVGNCKISSFANTSCIAHFLFGMDIFECMKCINCGLQSRSSAQTLYFHHVNAFELRRLKGMCRTSSFDVLLHFLRINDQFSCDRCHKLNHISHTLSNPPRFFTIVLGWRECESDDDINDTIGALDTKIDIAVFYPQRGLKNAIKYKLVSVICYIGEQCRCFAYSHEGEKWLMCDDTLVEVSFLFYCEVFHLV